MKPKQPPSLASLPVTATEILRGEQSAIYHWQIHNFNGQYEFSYRFINEKWKEERVAFAITEADVTAFRNRQLTFEAIVRKYADFSHLD